MSEENRTKDDEASSSAPPPFKKLKAAENGSSMYAPEPVKPEWLELPPELHHYAKSSSSSSSSSSPSSPDSVPPSAAWNKYYPYDKSRHLPLTPLNQPPTFTSESPALCFQVHGICGRARACTLHFPNGGPPVPTPRFMPVGTKGTLKAVLPSEISDMNCPIILANTYHLAIQPGTELIDEIFGGLPKFMGSVMPEDNSDKAANKSSVPPKRRFNLLTDSGGFQMVSLAALSQVTEKGVLFESPYTGKPMLLKPEDSIRCQNEIGADIIMQLDDVVSSVATDDNRFKIATFRTLRWYDRCVNAHQCSHQQNLFPIMQGALDVSQGGLRELCLAGFKHRDEQAQKHVNTGGEGSVPSKLQQRIPGFAIGGLAGGESKEEFWMVVDHACRHLPDDRPRYLMGVGYPLDLVVCTALGVDQYDCVYPTRTARFGVALTDAGLSKLKQHEFIFDDHVIEEGCPCQACSRGVSRKRLHMLLKSGNTSVAIQLLTQHNVCYMMGLVNRMREAILEQRYPAFCRQFLAAQFLNPADIPSWVVDALGAAGITIDNGTEATSNLDFIMNVDQLRKNTSFDPTQKNGLWDELKREWDTSFQELDEIQANANKEKLDKWFDRLYQQHNESGRYYHTTVHLMEMMRYWNIVVAEDLSLSKHSPAICWATFFHDAVYDPKSSTNEEDSAKLFEEFCSDALGIQRIASGDNDSRVAKVASLASTLILATKKHEVIPNEMMSDSENDLQKIFLDIDMSVLGKHENAYLAYAGCIRKEYSFVEKSVYCGKRAEILTGFLENKKQIFLSDLFHKTSETQARSNLKREIELLKQGSIPGAPI
ncbi:unnamed protein product [Cylindrotheca closterium]|uniref:tRNA-guanine(15) transglycosylase-like domain-containing protein n=1 Tax=Cylindrotheca closterium TaxID=2856 RepID=A0AAD2G7S8_9STRA|nr:unnamed protein product [Cylindrotheca closterium]